jgi:hypothetical protein
MRSRRVLITRQVSLIVADERFGAGHRVIIALEFKKSLLVLAKRTSGIVQVQRRFHPGRIK